MITEGRCKLLATGSTGTKGMVLWGDSLYYGTWPENEVRRLKLDGTSNSVLGTKADATVLAVHQDRLLVETSGCDSHYDTCLSTLPLTGGEFQPTFPTCSIYTTCS